MGNWEENVRRVVPYTPGEQPNEPGMIKLNTNENPYPPSPKVAEAIRSFDEDRLRLYPDPTAGALVNALAERYQLKPSQVFVGVGSDDVLAMCFLTFFNSKKPILFPDITYSFYDVGADVFRIPYEVQPLDDQRRIRKEEDEKENNSGRSARFFFLRQAGWILMLFALRSALFLYLYYNHRPVVRLTHSIYLAEAVILLWMIAKALEGRKKGGIAVFLLLSLVFLAAAGIQVREITEEQNSRLAKNAPYEEFLDYCREHPENVYLTDVYSTVDFSDPLFAAGGKPVNYDLMGGWASKSPLEREKLENLGVLPPETENCSENAGSFAGETAPALDEILLAHENVYVAAETGADLSWLTEYYAAKGQQASVKEEDRIGNDWVIYSVE